jgi:ribose transport system ATP-binding protein
MVERDVPALELVEVEKAYPGVRALKAVSLNLRAGEVHALVGENGAGKSTIVKILGGVEHADAGAVRLLGRDVKFASPLAARRAGIAVIHQELSLLPQMTIAQNLLLGREELIGRFGIMSRSRRYQLSRAMLDRFDLPHDPDTLVASLPVSEQQLVEIARALSEDAKVILMDEPTAALTEIEATALFAKIEELKGTGVAILYVSHRLDEIKRLADRITVLRDGAVVALGAASDFSVAQIITAMVGRTIADRFPPREARVLGEKVFEVTDPAAVACGGSISVRAGEIVGLAGLVGSGRSEWAQGVFCGLKDNMSVRGRAIMPRSPHDSRQLGIGFVPGDRKVQGLFADLSVRENLTITLLDRLANAWGVLYPSRLAETARALIARLSIRCPSDRIRVGALSGGNQQKVAMAKWLARESDILFLEEPTRGIDIGAKEEIYRLILQIARAGKAVVLVSSELPELLCLSDRIYVMRSGRFVGEVNASQSSQEELVALASGG